MLEGGWDDVVEIINAVVSFMLFVTFFIYTYYDDANPQVNIEGHAWHGAKPPEWLTVVETVLIFFIIADYMLGFFLTEQRVSYIFSFQAFITYLSVVPLMLVNFGVVTDTSIIKNASLYVWRVARYFSILRLAKMFTR